MARVLRISETILSFAGSQTLVLMPISGVRHPSTSLSCINPVRQRERSETVPSDERLCADSSTPHAELRHASPHAREVSDDSAPGDIAAASDLAVAGTASAPARKIWATPKLVRLNDNPDLLDAIERQLGTSIESAFGLR